MMQLTWKASEPASAIYAATCLSTGLPVADARLAEAFAPAVDMLLAEFAACTAPADRLLPLLTGLASRGVDENRQLVEQALTKLFGRLGDRSPMSASVGRLAGAIAGVKAAFQTAYSKTADSRPLVDELSLRSRPLLEQWESRGPGLLLQLARSTEENVLVSNAEVALVYPFVGGHGMAHHPLNCVTFEAVLTNPIESLPEVLRLAWLLAQLNVDLPMYSDHVSAARRDAVGQLALVPAVLAAAEYVELTHFSAASIGKTLAAWRLVDAATAADPVSAQSKTLLSWWNTYQQGETPWAVALGALEQMLYASPDQP
jgi:hypothetical protein